MPSVFFRKVFVSDVKFPGDLQKAVAKIHELGSLDNPPLRLPLGKDAVQAFRAQIASVTANVDLYESWSEDLALESDGAAKLF